MGEELNNEVKTGPSGLSIFGFIAAFLLAPLGAILSIVALVKKDGRGKGFAIAGLIIGVINTFIGLLSGLILIGTMAPQVIKYVEKSNVAQDTQYADCIRNALITAALDPSVITKDTVPETQSYKDITTIPNGEFRDSVEEILGCDLDDLHKQIKSHDTNDVLIQYRLYGSKCSVKITDKNESDTSSFYILVE